MIKIHTALFAILMLISAIKMDNIQEQEGTLSQKLEQAPVKHQLSYIDQDEKHTVIPAFSEEKHQPKVKMLSTSTEEKASKPKPKKRKRQSQQAQEINHTILMKKWTCFLGWYMPKQKVNLTPGKSCSKRRLKPRGTPLFS